MADKPLYILNITQGHAGQEVNSANYRFHLDVGANAQMQVIEHYISSDGENRHFTGARLTATIGDNASFNHIKLGLKMALANILPITI